MDAMRIGLACKTLRGRSTEDLLRIWVDNDREEWSAEAFEAIRRLLAERGQALPEQGAPRARRPRGLSWSAIADSPAGALFRLELRRRWRRPTAVRAALILAVIVLAELALVWAWARPVGPSYPGGFWWVPGVFVRFLFEGHLGPQNLETFLPLGPRRAWEYLPLALTAVPGAAAVLLMPLFAAMSLAPDHQAGRLDELMVTRLRPADILLAKGSAHPGPFVLLSLVGCLAAMAAQHFVYTYGTHVLHNPFAVVVDAGVLLGISTLCRRTWAALSACCVAQLGCVITARWPTVAALSGAGWPMPVSELLLLAPAAALLALALRSLRYPR